MIEYYIVDAFADRIFQGNPAGVCPLERALPPEPVSAPGEKAGPDLSDSPAAVPAGRNLLCEVSEKTVTVCGSAALYPRGRPHL